MNVTLNIRERDQRDREIEREIEREREREREMCAYSIKF